MLTPTLLANRQIPTMSSHQSKSPFLNKSTLKQAEGMVASLADLKNNNRTSIRRVRDSLNIAEAKDIKIDFNSNSDDILQNLKEQIKESF